MIPIGNDSGEIQENDFDRRCKACRVFHMKNGEHVVWDIRQGNVALLYEGAEWPFLYPSIKNDADFFFLADFLAKYYGMSIEWEARYSITDQPCYRFVARRLYKDPWKDRRCSTCGAVMMNDTIISWSYEDHHVRIYTGKAILDFFYLPFIRSESDCFLFAQFIGQLHGMRVQYARDHSIDDPSYEFRHY